ncbi:DUF1080 domain-containing protein [Cellvibrio sp.]|uniref:3-keto-disaccharide hydrolase n=1 Tax=Cellvibrio sp. TaxID=1965322 RepID=UPI0039648015
MKNIKPLAFAIIATLPLTSFAASSSSSKIPDWKLAEATEVWSPVPPVVTANENTPPSDAIVLFDGKSLSQWQAVEGGDAKWSVQNGSFTVVPKTGDIKTKESFCDVQLHVEWATPTKVTGDDGKELTSQARNNSGIFLQEQYEVQVLDSYNNKTYSNGQAGSIYKQHIPLVNPTRAPGVWQTYDIIFTAPKFSDDKKLISPSRATVLLNGVLVQNNVEIQGATGWIGKPVYTAHGCAPLRLQDHGNPVSFRNIWIRKL